MSTKIEWCDKTWNPTTGCTKVSPGCAHCYIERQTPMRVAGRRFVRGKIPIVLHPERLGDPLRWRTPRRVFVNSMSDLFHEDVPDTFIDQVFAVMALAPWHTFQILTKRPERMRAYATGLTSARVIDATNTNVYGGAHRPGAYNLASISSKTLSARARAGARDSWMVSPPPLPNVWLGVSVENQRMADERIPLLLETPAAVRFLSCEPLLGPVDLRPRPQGAQHLCIRCGEGPAATHDHVDGYRTHGLDWVIVGGESGPRRRPMELSWARILQRQCEIAGVPFFMKQLGGPAAGNTLEDLPEDLRIREYPA